MNTITILYKFVKYIFPLVDSELKGWKDAASLCPDKILSHQAISSIENKAFHAQGGSVFALYPGADAPSLVKLIVAYQTISDYLDNLCDRVGVEDEDAFFCLHQSMTDALRDSPLQFHDYYSSYPYTDDGGYLRYLIAECNNHISKLPTFNFARKYALEFAGLYSSLQAYKHLSQGLREEKLFTWTSCHIKEYPELMPWEFWAATGSTLGIFMLFAAASTPFATEEEFLEIKRAYFPWVCGLHILLDYFIDYNEDIKNQDLNFVTYYKDECEILDRIVIFIENSLLEVSNLKYPVFHSTVVLGLLALYLSDPKASSPNLKSITNRIIISGGTKLKYMHKLCKTLRGKGIV